MNTKPKKGLRSYYPTDKGPIDTYQLGHDGRIEYLAAEIGTDHLTKGINTTDEWKKWAKERGAPTDEPGLILSKRLGGSGIDSVNLFPKSPALGKSSWAEDEDKAYTESIDMKKWKKMKFFCKFEYPEDDSLRPSEIEYQYELPSGTVLHSKVSNEVQTGGTEDTKAEAEDEESEYEYEYEEEEEEAAPAEAQPEPEKVKVEQEVTPIKERVPSPVPVKPELKPEPVSSYTPPKPEPVPVVPVQSPPPKPTETYKFQAPAPPVSDFQSKQPSPPPQSQKQKSPTPTSADKGAHDNSLFTRSDFIEMLPIIGSIKLVADTLQALFHGNFNLAFWKAFQCGISVFGDFNFMRGFARHGKILAKPITEENLIRFANKAEPHIIIFGACKAGNQVLSSLKRILS